jgi:hypothetical protein
MRYIRLPSESRIQQTAARAFHAAETGRTF